MHPDVCIAGAGIIGLSLALELTRRGARVTILDRGAPLGEASFAAAGMLAGCDPFNPPQLQPLADLSIGLYPAFLDHLANLSDIRIPFQTELTLQATHLPSVNSLSQTELNIFLPAHHLSKQHFSLLDEHSIDPRQLAPALLAAAANTSITLHTGTPVLRVESSDPGLTVITPGAQLETALFIDCTGAWAATCPAHITPCKGQMLSVALSDRSALSLVLRTEDLYIVPRTSGPNAGRAIIGATVEDAGFDKTVHAADIARLREQAIRLLPALADAPVLEQWAGLRPVTADRLPLLGPTASNPRHLLAIGHFRNGILLAPATAHVLSQLIFGEPPAIDLTPFSPERFSAEAIP